MSCVAKVMLLSLIAAWPACMLILQEEMLLDRTSQKKMNIKACVPIRRKDDNWNAQFTAQQLQNKDLMTTESKPSSSKAKQTFLDLTSPSNRTAIGELKNVESKTPDFPIAIFIYRTDCRSMLLISRVLQLLLTYALNLANSIRAANIKHWINGVGF